MFRLLVVWLLVGAACIAVLTLGGCARDDGWGDLTRAVKQQMDQQDQRR